MSSSCAASASLASTTTATAGEAVDDDTKERGNGIDDAAKDAGDAVDDGHDSSSNGAEHSLDLVWLLADEVVMIWVVEATYARYNSSHFDGVLISC